ncbi:MAG: response regulator [Ectothiorhodospiraceae bacterium]|nr:response regulator [Ectothiorhodospiraceae bacterium]
MAKILIVDDEAPLRTMLSHMLIADNHEVIVAEDGGQGIKLYHEGMPDLVISDLVMPNKNGIDMILELKRDYPDLRLIAISGGGGITGAFDYLPTAKLVGADSILKKPFGIQELRDALKKSLGN